MHPALGCHQLALQHNFGVGWYHEVDRLTLNELRRLAVEAPEHFEVVHVRRKALESSQLVDDGRADDDCDFKVLALRSRLLSVDAGAVRRAGMSNPRSFFARNIER